jgi:hypothetical protein
VLQARERGPTPCLSIVFCLGLTFGSLKEFGSASQAMMQATSDGGVHDNNFFKLVIFSKLDVAMIIHFLIMELKLLIEISNLVTFSFS